MSAPMNTTLETPVGPLTLVRRDGALTGAYFDVVSHPPRGFELGEATTRGFERETEQFEAYFAGTLREFDIPLGPIGTEFQLRVWAGLQTIPYGTTISYQDFAIQLGDVLAIRAVAAANGRNPLGIVIPCHRVIGSDGSLTGYAGGLHRKRFLLDLEEASSGDTQRLF